MILTTMKEDKLNLTDDNPVFIFKDIKEVLQELYDHYRDVESRNEYLLKENARIESEKYKDEELAKMKEKYDKMYADYYRGFPITEEQQHKINEWMNKQKDDMGIPITRFHYEFYPTSLGVAGYVVDDITKERFQFQEIG